MSDANGPIQQDSTASTDDGMIRFRLEASVACAFALIGIFVAIYCSITLQFMAVYGPGPAFAPVLTGAALAAISIAKLLAILKADRTWIKAVDVSAPELKKSTIVVILTIIAVVLMDVLGSTVSLALFSFIIMRWIQKEKWLSSIMTAAVLPACLVWIFRVPLSIPIPQGYFF